MRTKINFWNTCLLVFFFLGQTHFSSTFANQHPTNALFGETADKIDFSSTALLSCTCPTTLGMMLDGCNGEDNEYLILWSGSGFNVADLAVDFSMFNDVPGFQNGDINTTTDTDFCEWGTPNNSLIQDISCNDVVYADLNDAVPANTIVVLFVSNDANPFLTDFSSLCNQANNPIYVLQNACNRDVGGLSNGEHSGLRTTIIRLNDSFCEESFTHDTDHPVIDGGHDGDFLVPHPLFGLQYGNNDCNPPFGMTIPTGTDTDTTFLTETICEGENLFLCGLALNNAGVYTLNCQDFFGCDSIVQLDLSIIEGGTENLMEEICEGDVFVVGDNIFEESGTYTITIEGGSYEGCDSTVFLDLDVQPIIVIELNFSICQGDAVTVGGVNYTDLGVYQIQGVGQNGCDSITLITIEVIPAGFLELTVIKCGAQSFQFGNNYYDSTGFYIDTLSSIGGCDSILLLDLTILPIDSTYLNLTACHGETIAYQNLMIDSTGLYNVTLMDYLGCDSVVILDAVINTEIAVADSTILPEINGAANGSIALEMMGGTAPYSFVWSNGETTQNINNLTAGIYDVVVTDANGCQMNFSAEVPFFVPTQDLDLVENIRIFPNPILKRNMLRLDFKQQNTQNITLELMDINGQLILAENCVTLPPSCELEMPAVSGIYFLEIRMGETVFVERVVVY